MSLEIRNKEEPMKKSKTSKKTKSTSLAKPSAKALIKVKTKLQKPAKKAPSKLKLEVAPKAAAMGAKKSVKPVNKVAEKNKSLNLSKHEEPSKSNVKPLSVTAKNTGKVKKEKTNKDKDKEGLVEMADDFLDEGFGSDEIGEYEEELREVESADEEEATALNAEETWINSGKEAQPEEVYLTDAEGNRYCRAQDCDQIANVDAYCRYHYLLFWKKIQVRKKILADGKLERYVDELTARYPDKFLEIIKRDLRTEKDFLAAIQELEIDESSIDNDFEDEAQNFIDEVRGLGEPAGMEDEEF